jgi:hypothetical protein
MVPTVVGSAALGSPLIDGVVFNERVFNDDPTSILTTVDTYPILISINDSGLDGGGGGGFANLHNFRLSADGGVSAAPFNNGDAFLFWADVTITGVAGSEGGLNVSPWWSQDVDGRLNVRTTDGEIAAFGGRLPFYSFTASQGLTYTAGDAIGLGVIYDPNSLSAADPATIEYLVNLGGTEYTSGALDFDQGNPAEDPPYGLWGMLNDARVGGYFQPFVDPSNPSNWGEIVFANMRYSPDIADVIPEPATLSLLALGGLGLLQRRRKR